MPNTLRPCDARHHSTLSGSRMTHLALSVESKDCEALLSELQALLSASPDWLRWLALEALEGLHEHVELLPVDGDSDSAPPAGDLRVLAKPADKLVLLVAALRAGNGHGCVGVRFPLSHGGPHA